MMCKMSSWICLYFSYIYYIRCHFYVVGWRSCLRIRQPWNWTFFFFLLIYILYLYKVNKYDGEKKKKEKSMKVVVFTCTLLYIHYIYNRKNPECLGYYMHRREVGLCCIRRWYKMIWEENLFIWKSFLINFFDEITILML